MCYTFTFLCIFLTNRSRCSLHRKYASKTLLDILCSLGICTSYSEVVRYQSSATQNSAPFIDGIAHFQYVFDNYDYNLRTLDGHGTFHAMGGIVCVTPKTAVHTNTRIPRKGVDTSKAVSCREVIPITVYQVPKTRRLDQIKVEDAAALKLRPDTLEVARRQDMLWICGMWLRTRFKLV